MNYCSKCGHELDTGRYCTNCGHPVGPDETWRTDTAERTVAIASPPPPRPPNQPPPPHTPPPPARFPLFADELDAEGGEDGSYDEAPAAPYHPAYGTGYESHPHRRRVWWPWLAGAAALLVVLGIGIALLTGGDEESPAATDPTSGPAGKQGHGGAGRTAADDASGELATSSQVTVPDTAPPGRDADGNPTTYDAENMLDGRPDTAWRMPGDGTGDEIVVTLPEESHLTSVGLVNGYAKTTDGIDWYHGNRRVESVEWVFDDGSTVTQDLGDSTDLQSTDVDVTTSSVTLRLVTVSRPGKGSTSRDYTAISDLSLIGG